VGHALAGHDWERAARLIEGVAEATFMRGEVATLLSWLEALPEEHIRPRPQLCLVHAWTLLDSGQLAAVEPRLQDVERELVGREHKEAETPALSETDMQWMLGHVAAIRGEIACSQGNVVQAIELSHQALELLPEEDLFVRAMSAFNIVMHFAEAYDSSADVRQASQILGQTIVAGQMAGDIQVAMYATRLLAQLEIAQGRLSQAAETYRRAVAMATEGDESPLPITGATYVGLGELHYEWNDLDAARRFLLAGIELGEPGSDARVLTPGYVTLARLNQARGDRDAANDMLQKAERLARQSDISWLITEVIACQAGLWLAPAGGNLRLAARWAQECGLNMGDQIGFRREGEYTALARVLIALEEYKRALALLDWLLGLMEQAGLAGRVIEILALKALALEAQNKRDDAITVLKRALTLAEPEGYIRLFVDEGLAMAALLRRAAAQGVVFDYVTKLLAAFAVEVQEKQQRSRGAGEQGSNFFFTPAPLHPRTPAQNTPALIEPLSERELEVLRLITAGLTNREIADELVIVVGTVKGHVNHIYRKLEVTNRVQAVSRARELKLL
jgi:LuxR family maltose regulon positive regulatory protein